MESELYALNDRVNQIYFGCLLQDELIRQNALLQKELQVNIEAYQGDDRQWRGESIGSGKYGSGTAECPPK